MKVLQQDTQFQPVAIVLETSEELETMWKILDRVQDSYVAHLLSNKICNEITNRVKS